MKMKLIFPHQERLHMETFPIEIILVTIIENQSNIPSEDEVVFD